MIIDWQKESNLLKYNVTGDCLTITLNWKTICNLGQNILNRFNFGVKLNFSLPHSLSRCTMLRKNLLSANNIV